MKAAASVSRLSLKSSNEYGEYEASALSLYGIEMVVEPYRETKLTTQASGGSKDPRFFWRVVEVNDGSDAPSIADGSAASVVFGAPSVRVREEPIVAFDAEGGRGPRATDRKYLPLGNEY